MHVDLDDGVETVKAQKANEPIVEAMNENKV